MVWQSTAIALDCDGHLYVLDGTPGRNKNMLEYSPDGTLVRRHDLAVPATSIAIDPGDRSKRLYTTSFVGDLTVYEYCLANITPWCSTPSRR